MATWNHDGTQEPVPPPVMSDPLSGPSAGGKFEAEAVRVRVVEPSMPDIEAVREAMASVLDENSELMVVVPARQPEPVVDMGANDPDAGDGGEGVGPAAAALPAPTPTPPVGIPVLVPPQLPSSRRIPLRRGLPRPLRRRTFSPGFAIVGVLLTVIAVLVVVMLINLIDTISSLFG